MELKSSAIFGLGLNNAHNKIGSNNKNNKAEVLAPAGSVKTGTKGIILDPIHNGNEISNPASSPKIVTTRIQKIRDWVPKIKCRWAATIR